MISTKFIFVIVVYRNTDDLKDLINSINSKGIDREIVVVNNYYDEVTMNKCKKISEEFDLHFLNVENKGYGFGNNRGIEYANKHFEYEFLVVSNPDIIIGDFQEENFDKYSKNVFGPLITTASKKNQNPYWVFNNALAEWMIYKGHLKKSKLLLFIGIAFNKIIRELFLCYFKKSKRLDADVFGLHGSFLVFSYKVLEQIGLPYDEEMFLFAEEAHLSHKLKKYNIKSKLTKNITVYHKEDGSMNLSKLNTNEEIRKSVITYYSKLNE